MKKAARATARRRKPVRVDRAAQSGNALNAAILNTVSDGILVVDDTSTIRELNPAAARMFGRTRADALGRPIDDLLQSSGSTDASERPFAVTAAARAGHRLEMTALHADGSRFPVELVLSRIRAQGTAQFAGVVRDISERKALGRAALERERLSAFAWDVGVALTEGRTLPAMLGRCARAMVDHLDAALARIWTNSQRDDGFELVASAGGPVSAGGASPDAFKIDEIARNRCPVVTGAVLGDPVIDQEWAAANVIVSFLGYPLIVGDRVVGVIAMFGRAPISDATMQALSSIVHGVASAIERDRIEASQARLAAVIEGTTDLVSVTMLDRSGRAYMNQAGRTLLGLSPGEPVPDLAAFRTEESRTEWTDVILPAALRDGLWAGETTYVNRSGRVIPVSQLLLVHAVEDGKIQLSTIARDNTARRVLEAQFRQAQKMDAIGHLAGGVAHDFNNLLTAILGYAKFAADGLAPEDRRRRDVDEIIKAAERAAGLTRQLLAFSRKQVLRSTWVDLNQLVTGVSELLRRLIGEHIALDVVSAPDLALVLADAGQLEQVVINLAVNARDAMEQGGRLTLETGNVQLHATSGLQDQTVVPGWYVMLAVVDTGVGMDAQTKRHLFEPFFTTKERGKGTGLGLATVYGIVKQSDGYIWAESEPGQGSAFRVYLPRAERHVERDAPAVASDSPLMGSETVLLVEDEAGVRQLARRILENTGYRVLDAASGHDAELIFAEHSASIDLLVTDVLMPGLSGPDLFLRLAVDDPGLKVVYISGYATEAMARQFGLDRSRPYLQKPFTANQLVSTVRSVLDGCDLPRPAGRPA